MLLRVHDIIVWLPFFVLYLLGYACGHLLSFLASHKPRECSALIMIPLLLCDRTRDEQAQDMARIKYFERSRLVDIGYNTAEPTGDGSTNKRDKAKATNLEFPSNKYGQTTSA